jgi:hypothetical protein
VRAGLRSSAKQYRRDRDGNVALQTCACWLRDHPPGF